MNVSCAYVFILSCTQKMERENTRACLQSSRLSSIRRDPAVMKLMIDLHPTWEFQANPPFCQIQVVRGNEEALAKALDKSGYAYRLKFLK
jgi:hypothetical protein